MLRYFRTFSKMWIFRRNTTQNPGGQRRVTWARTTLCSGGSQKKMTRPTPRTGWGWSSVTAPAAALESTACKKIITVSESTDPTPMIKSTTSARRFWWWTERCGLRIAPNVPIPIFWSVMKPTHLWEWSLALQLSTPPSASSCRSGIIFDVILRI